MVDPKASMEEIKKSYTDKAKFYDPEITGDRSNVQLFEELTLAYTTLIKEETREGYDLYLASVGINMSKEKLPDIDPEEVERRR